jgi:hypothetical protein
MKNFRKLLVFGGLIAATCLQADHCSKSGVSITNMASVPGVEYTLYVNIGAKPKKSEAVVFGLTSGYAVLKSEQALCFKNAFKKSTVVFVRQAHEKGQPKNPAYKFDVAQTGITDIKSIDIISGATGFELNVYGKDGSMAHLKSRELFEVK